MIPNTQKVAITKREKRGGKENVLKVDWMNMAAHQVNIAGGWLLNIIGSNNANIANITL